MEAWTPSPPHTPRTPDAPATPFAPGPLEANTTGLVLSPDATLRQAAQMMRSHAVDALPVFESDDLVGVITEYDIMVRAVADGRDPNRATVRDAMTWQVFYVEERGPGEGGREYH